MRLWIGIHLPHGQQAIHEVAMAMLHYTPDVSINRPRCVLLDVTASLQLFGGVRRLWHRVVCTLRQTGFNATLAMAPTASGAWLLATSPVPAARRCLQMATLQQRLNRLPCSSLPALAPYLGWLGHIGCTSLGTLRQLPRAGLKRRTQADILQTLDQAYGMAPEQLSWFIPAPVFRQRLQLPQRTEIAHTLLFFAQRLLNQLGGWLAKKQQACTQLVFLFEHETGRQACPPSRLVISFGLPARYPADMAPLVAEHLQYHRLAAPAIAISLHVHKLQQPTEAPVSLFPEPGGTAANRQQVLDLIAARLGPENILMAAPQADHRPETANCWLPAKRAGKPTQLSMPDKLAGTPFTARQPDPSLYLASVPGPGHHRPFWLLDTPLPLKTRQHRPFYQHPLRIVQGPERIEDGWWSHNPVQRDYFVAQAPNGALYWLFQDRQQKRWFLHGLFA